MGKMTAKAREEYNKLTANTEQIQFRLDELTGPMTYGYARVSTTGQAQDGNSLNDQRAKLTAAGAQFVYADVFTGTKIDRPKLQTLLKELEPGDTLIVTRLDRLGRSVAKVSELISELMQRGIILNVLNLGILSNDSISVLMQNILLTFAQFERDMLVERTQEGKAVARQRQGYREGRPKKYPKTQLDHAMELLNNCSYSQVAEMTGISKATLVRERKRRKQSH